MSDVGAIGQSSPLQGLKPAAQAMRVTPSRLTESQFAKGLASRFSSSSEIASDTINFSKAAEQIRSGQGIANPSPTYGPSGLQGVTPIAARQALAASASQMIAARVSQAMDFESGQAPVRGPAMPFYTNPAQTNTVATNTSAARALGNIGGSIDATG